MLPSNSYTRPSRFHLIVRGPGCGVASRMPECEIKLAFAVMRAWRSLHCTLSRTYTRLCGDRAAHFLLRSQYSEVCMCRPLRSWKVPSSVSDCTDGGLGISLPRSARVVAVTGPAPLSLPSIHIAHEVDTPFPCELRSERARPPRVPLAHISHTSCRHILSYGRTTSLWSTSI